MSRTVLCVSLAFFLLCLFPGDALGEERNRMGIEETIQKEEADDKEEENGLTLSELDFSSVEEILERTGQGTESFSFEELLDIIFQGRCKGSLRHGVSQSLGQPVFRDVCRFRANGADFSHCPDRGSVYSCFPIFFREGRFRKLHFM